MKTPRSVEVTKMTDGSEYWHQGLELCLRNCFKDPSSDEIISINISIDGLPLFNSATKCFSPILFNVFEHPKISPMAIGIPFESNLLHICLAVINVKSDVPTKIKVSDIDCKFICIQKEGAKHAYGKNIKT